MKRFCARLAALMGIVFIFASASSWAAPANWPPSLVIGTGSPGGVYFPYGEALAPILTEALGIPVAAQATQASAQNLMLLESGNAQLGFTLAGIALEGWNGTGAWTHDKKLRSMRALFSMYGSPFEMAALKSSGIRSYPDMAGKRIAAGPPSGAGALYAEKFFRLLGIQATLRYGAWETSVTQMQSALVDAFFSPLPDPAPPLTELDRTAQIGFIPMTADEIAKLCTAIPELVSFVVPAGTYPSMTTDYTTVGTFNLAVVSKDLPDDLVYEILKAFYASHGRLVKAVPAAWQSVVENVKRVTVLPYHPGAVRYYGEIGIALRDNLTKAE